MAAHPPGGGAGWHGGEPARVPVIRLWGTPVRVHLSVVLLVLALAAVHQAGRGLVLFASVLLHELAHAACARRLGVRVYSVELLPFGGVAHLDEPAMVPPAREVGVALAGPAANGLLAGLGMALRLLDVPLAAAWPLERWTADQLALALFNLLPVFPLDGGRVVRAWLVRRMGFYRASDAAVQLGWWAGLFMVVAGTASYLATGGGLWAAMMGGFVAYAARQEGRRLGGLWARYLDRLSEAEAQGVREVRALAAPAQLPLKEVTAYWIPGRYHLLLLTDRQGRLVGLAEEAAVVRAFMEHGPHSPAGRAAWRRW